MGHEDDHQDRARPVSGEIMSTAAPRTPTPRADDDISDAQYETVPAAPGGDEPRFARADAASGDGMDFLKTGAPAAPKGGRGGVVFWGLGVVAILLAFWISGGHALIGRGGPAAATGPKTPLRIVDVASRVETRDGRGVLFVDGRAENHGADTLPLPPVEIAVTANDGAVTRYRLPVGNTELKPGDRYAFSSRLEAPGAGVKTVSVAFQEGER